MPNPPLKLKINFFSGSSPIDGIATYTDRLRKSLEKSGVKTDLLSPLPRSDIETKNLQYLTRNYSDLGRKMNQADIAHIQHEYSYFSNYDRKVELFRDFIQQIKIPKVITVHEVPENPIGTPKSSGVSGQLRKVLNFITRKDWLEYQNAGFANDCDLVLVHTHFSKKALLDRGVTTPIQVIPLPPPDARIQTKDLRKDLGLVDKFVLMTFGQINPRKGFERVVDTLKSLPEDVVYLVAGDIDNPERENYLKKLKVFINSRGLGERVVFYGPIKDEDIPNLFNTADLYIASMISTTASSTIAYGLAYHIPTIATDLPATREINTEIKCLELFDGTSEDLSLKIKRLYLDENSRKELSLKSKQYCDKYSQDNYTKQLMDLYRKVQP